MSRKLTSHEKYLLSQTNSKASTPAAQRAAIRRAGLEGMYSKEIEKKRLENWKKSRQQNPGVPDFVLALQSHDYLWSHRPPKSIKAGTPATCRELMRIAYDLVDWGRTRKHSLGSLSVYGFRIREEDNGKWGWDKVVNRYADYGCVVSPCGKKIAYSIRGDSRGPVWIVTSFWRGRFRVGGNLLKVDKKSASPRPYSLRTCKRILTNAGFDAYLTRQSEEQISQGSGEKGRKGELVLIVNFGRDGFYHARATIDVVAEAKRALKSRVENREQEELNEIVDRGEAEGVFVCAADSYKAGNCRPGTAAFASSHGFDLRKHYTARELLEVSNGSTRFVRAAIVHALRRERKEMSQGYAELSDHRA